MNESYKLLVEIPFLERFISMRDTAMPRMPTPNGWVHQLIAIIQQPLCLIFLYPNIYLTTAATPRRYTIGRIELATI